MAKWLGLIESALGQGPSGPKRVRTVRWLLIIGAAGIGLMIMNSFLSLRQVEPTAQSHDEPPAVQETLLGHRDDSDSVFEALERPLENRLKEILEKIVGVGTVDVLITIDSTEESVIEKNEKQSQQLTEETDKNGGKRHVTSTTKDGQVVLYEVSGEQTPLVTKKIKPHIRGILIVARGAENQSVRQLIMDAVKKGYSVPAHRISVVPSKQP
ncbi:stage III sporulation protein AG [Paenibacillus sp. GCM10012307]|uniref:Stage III sporulation protein AG n=1 Tax=Paenibacillus roseus TaxID=2798579 RepID=A0A934MXJ3_9BACL|nr:stage III sporulation protein AG [Paenibacillus roseus]MBJ6364242.1 stage III sporulation protein AG [Paenibacillus roseus]